MDNGDEGDSSPTRCCGTASELQRQQLNSLPRCRSVRQLPPLIGGLAGGSGRAGAAGTGRLGGKLSLAPGGDGEQMLTRAEAGHCRTFLGYGLQAGPLRDGVREREEGISTRQAGLEGTS
ncbi:unnamed protein product [Pleuronectes platessa]|uniref:Uncharacterized protein n=1 Tax=Pleuronectes platessa TaxID=8262 RepID=A0A9N7ZCR7_PLEPL|nr:unnamed protein product [Pleuronectes platessa]